MAVAIWTTSRDQTSDLVESRLRARNIGFIRLDTDRYGDGYRVAWDQAAGASFIDDSGHRIDARELSAVYYRRPSVVEVPRDERDFALHETWYFVRALLLGLRDARWMNHPSAVLEAENKVLQLDVARGLGFAVPPTVLTSDPMQAWTFYDTHGQHCVCKPGYAGLMATADTASAVYAWRVPKNQGPKDFESVHQCPTLLQQEVDKTCDVRVTAVGNELFATRITSATPDLLDWRQQLGEGLRYERVPVDPDVERKVMALLAKLRLSYGALDFAETPQGEWVFLEINPAGQWGWLELEANLPIGDSIAGWLGGA